MQKDYNDNIAFDQLDTAKFEQMTYKDQLHTKSAYIKSLFNKDILPIVPNPKPRAYRHKAVLSATNINVNNTQQLRLGLFIEGSRHIKPKLGHYLHDEAIDQVFVTIESLLNKYKFKAYTKIYRQGIIKHVMMRKSFATGEMMVIFATNLNTFPNYKKLVNDLIAVHPIVTTVIQNIHRKDSKFVLLDEERILYGKGYIIDQIEDIKFKISPNAFYQINPMQMFNLYNTVFEFAQIKLTDTVVDAYSGIGTITLLAAKFAKKVYGLEINPASHKDAIDNKRINNIENAHFILGDVEDTLLKLNASVDCLIMDPARDGASLKFTQNVLKLKPKKIIYVSCNPETQERDYKQLRNHYTLTNMQAFDMFSYTPHVETVALLSLK
jgi:23S rRNA (uracil1939-C5)-methyltransferase